MAFVRERLKPKGRVEIFISEKAPLIIPGEILFQRPFGLPPVYRSARIDFSHARLQNIQDIQNLILNQGRSMVLQALTTGFALSIARMAVGDRGTIPSDSTIPKTPVPTQTSLFNEVFRSDIDNTILSVDGPNPTVQFIKTFSAANIPQSSYSNQANPAINEVGLVIANLFTGVPLPRADVTAPNSAPTDEQVFAMRTFKSVPFDAASSTAVTIRYTLSIE